jgi:hypothetical protein
VSSNQPGDRTLTAVALVTTALAVQGGTSEIEDFEPIINQYLARHPEDLSLGGLLLASAQLTAFVLHVWADHAVETPEQLMQKLAATLAN